MSIISTEIWSCFGSRCLDRKKKSGVATEKLKFENPVSSGEVYLAHAQPTLKMSSKTKKTHNQAQTRHNNVPHEKDSKANHWSVNFLLFAMVATWSAFYNGIWDCDESMNYFEPLHQVLFGYGLQTWEYRYEPFPKSFSALH